MNDEYDEDEHSNSKNMNDEEDINDQFECCSSEDFTDDSNHVKHKTSSHSSQKKLIDVYSDNDLGSTNNTHSNRNSPELNENSNKRKMYDFYSEVDNNVDDEREEHDETQSENLNKTTKNDDMKRDENYEIDQNELINQLEKEETSNHNGETSNGFSRKKKILTKSLAEKNNGSYLERDLLKTSMFSPSSFKQEDINSFETSKSFTNSFLPSSSSPVSSAKGK